MMASGHKSDHSQSSVGATSRRPACSANSSELRDKFCAAMRHFAGACCVIATADGEEYSGLTATAVCSVTADPPRLLVVVNRMTVNRIWRSASPVRTTATRVSASGTVSGISCPGARRGSEHAWPASKARSVTPSPRAHTRFS